MGGMSPGRAYPPSMVDRSICPGSVKLALDQTLKTYLLSRLEAPVVPRIVSFSNIRSPILLCGIVSLVTYGVILPESSTLTNIYDKPHSRTTMEG